MTSLKLKIERLIKEGKLQQAITLLVSMVDESPTLPFQYKKRAIHLQARHSKWLSDKHNRFSTYEQETAEYSKLADSTLNLTYDSFAFLNTGILPQTNTKEDEQYNPETNTLHINSTKSGNTERPLVLHNGLDIEAQYFERDWNPKLSVPYFDNKYFGDRICPGVGIKYPYLVISDFLEETLLELPYALDSFYFFSGNPQNFFSGDTNSMDYPDKGFLIPITPLYFSFFSIDDLKNQLTIIRIDDDSVKVQLRTPINNSKPYVLFERTYTRNVKPDRSTNQGSIVECPVSIAITPFGVDNTKIEQVVGLIDASYDNYEISFFSENQSGYNYSSPRYGKYKYSKRSNIDTHSHNATSTYVRIQENYDLIRIESTSLNHKGFFIPNIRKRIDGKQGKKFIFAIDFRPDLTHIEFSYDNHSPRPFEISITDDRQLITSGNSFWRCRDYPMLFDLIEIELYPLEIGNESKYEFPIKSVTTEIQGLQNYTKAQPLTDISIRYGYSFLIKLNNEVITTNLDYKIIVNNERKDINEKRIQSFIEVLFFQIRNKVLMNDGNIKETEIIWFHPPEMQPFLLNKCTRIWNEAYQKYFNNNKLPCRYSQIEVQKYQYLEEYKINTNAPLVNICIGKTITEVSVSQNTKPLFQTSFNFAFDACFGEAYSLVGSGQNGFFKYYKGIVEHFLSQNQTDLFDLYQTFQKLTNIGSINSTEIMDFFFSIKSNNQVTNNNLDFNLTKIVSEDNGFKIIFIIFFSAIIYHIAKMLKTSDIQPPEFICINDRKSRIIQLLDDSYDLSAASKLARLIFEKVYDRKLNIIKIIQSKQPLSVTSKGGILKHQSNPIQDPSNKIVLLGDQYNTSLNKDDYMTYSEYLGNPNIIQDTVSEVHSFIDTILNLNYKLNFNAYFGLDTSKIEVYRKILKAETYGRIHQGITYKSRITHSQNSTIDETLFFYPLVIGLLEITKFIHKDKTS